MTSKSQSPKSYSVGDHVIEEGHVRRMFESHPVMPLNPEQFRALLFDLLVNEIDNDRPQYSLRISEVLAATRRDEDDLKAAVTRKRLWLRCLREGLRCVGVEADIESVDRTLETLDRESGTKTIASDVHIEQVQRERRWLELQRGPEKSLLPQTEVLAKLIEIQSKAAREIGRLVEHLGELCRESFVVDEPNFARIQYLTLLTSRLYGRIDATYGSSRGAQTELEDAQSELSELCEIRDNQDFPLVIQWKMAESYRVIEAELPKLWTEEWPLSERIESPWGDDHKSWKVERS